MKRPARRSILRMIALLLAWLIAGAALNVVMAWGCAYWIDGLTFAQNGGACIGSNRTCAAIPEYPPDIQREADAWESSTGLKITRLTHELWIDAHGLPMAAMVSRAYLSPEYAMNYVGISMGPWLDAQTDGVPLTLTPWEQHVLITRQLPLQPVWPGFAINTLFYAGVLWMLWAMPFALRRMIRRRRGQCAACAYPIGTNERCTECGAAVAASDRRCCVTTGSE